MANICFQTQGIKDIAKINTIVKVSFCYLASFTVIRGQRFDLGLVERRSSLSFSISLSQYFSLSLSLSLSPCTRAELGGVITSHHHRWTRVVSFSLDPFWCVPQGQGCSHWNKIGPICKIRGSQLGYCCRTGTKVCHKQHEFLIQSLSYSRCNGWISG